MNRSATRNARLACWTVAVVVLMAIWGQWAASLGAQQDAPADAARAAPAPVAAPEAGKDGGPSSREDQSLGRLIFVDSGPISLGFYLVQAAFSIAALTVILERLVRLQRAKVMPPEFVQRLHDLVVRNEDTLENFRNLAAGSNAPIARILKGGILRAGRPLPEVEKAMEDSAAREMADLQSRNRPLSVIGSIAPLIGLLGTVIGMILAFMVSSREGLGKAELLAKGIYLALMTTAIGLTMAIPCLLFYAWFNARAERFMRDMDETLLETMPSFARMENFAANTHPDYSRQGADHATATA
jgi:biopolymer transport protein ExbB